MTDALFSCGQDGGDITVTNGTIALGDGLEAAAYLSLFGGNEDDSGMDGDVRKQWWGNLSEPDPERQYRSETQRLLAGMPLVTANLKRAEDAAGRDLAWMVPSIATSVSVSAAMPAIDTIRLDIQIVVDGRTIEFSFTRSGVTG